MISMGNLRQGRRSSYPKFQQADTYALRRSSKIQASNSTIQIETVLCSALSMSVASVAHFQSVARRNRFVEWSRPRPTSSKGMALRLYLPKDFPTHTARLVPESETTKVIAGTPGSQSALRFARSRSSEARRIIEHTVKRGENVWKLSKRYRVNMDSLKAVNGWNRLPRLSPGRIVRIPVAHSPKPKGKARKRSPKKEARGRS